MSDAITTILTTADAREDQQVELAFINSAEAGGPWGSAPPVE